ncbi:winged helix-turn-helix domain-containing protein [Streptomyces sp. NPDC060065]|uniref:helix-turn-helix domain-containing protein n=1 Tax=Streptomyces sp. NPDC060065 TaxID=3347050 RepID=UPI0036978D95
MLDAGVDRRRDAPAVRGGLHAGGVDLLLHRIGLSVQVPARRATERDESRIAAWKDEQWPVMEGRRQTWVPGSASKTRQVRARGRRRAGVARPPSCG